MDPSQVEDMSSVDYPQAHARRGKNIVSSLTSGISRHPGAAFAVIVVLVVVVIYMFLQSRGIVGGLGGKKKKFRAKKKGSAAEGEAADEDPEIDDLIAEINAE